MFILLFSQFTLEKTLMLSGKKNNFSIKIIYSETRKRAQSIVVKLRNLLITSKKLRLSFWFCPIILRTPWLVMSLEILIQQFSQIRNFYFELLCERSKFALKGADLLQKEQI